jgi:peptidoglycan/LPS O-acetylase OafA/YrhL
VVSVLSYKYIETPFLKLKQRFEVVTSRPIWYRQVFRLFTQVENMKDVYKSIYFIKNQNSRI